jgi:hypothetical protein
MAELKTRQTGEDVTAFLDSVDNEQRRKDAYTILKLMKSVTRAEPKMWGPSIVGFGSYHYVYESGREGDWFLTGFSPRKQTLTLYIMAGFERCDELMQKLGKYKTGKSCLYINKLENVDMKVLKELVAESVRHMKKNHSHTT